MNYLKYKQPNYKYLHNQERRTLKQGFLLMASIAALGGYANVALKTNLVTDVPVDLSTTVLAREEQEITPTPVVKVLSHTSTPVGAPKPTTAPQKTQRSEIEEYIIEVFGGSSQTMVAIAKCESNLRENAYNDNYKKGKVWSTDWSILQVNDYFHNSKALNLFGKKVKDLTWRENIQLGKVIFDHQGYRGWSCYKSGAYLKHL